MGIYKDKESKEWVYKFEYMRKAYGARGFGTRREAEAARAKRREEVKTKVVAAPQQTITATGFKSIANDYLDFAQRKFVKDVYLRKVNVCRSFRASLPDGDLPIDEITPRHIHDYLKILKTNSLYNEHRQELSALFNWAKRIYAAQVPLLMNPCTGVEAMTHVTAEKEIPTEKDVLRMIAAAKPGDERDILLVCIQTLGRIDEVLRLRWHEDVNFDKRHIILWTRKRKNGAYEPDVLPMNKDLHDVLMSCWKGRKQDRWVFWNEKANEGKGDRFKHRPRLMDAVCKRAGLDPLGTRTIVLTPAQVKAFEKKHKRAIREEEKRRTVPRYYGFHSLRHFMASYLMDEEKVSLKTVSGMLRHKAVRTTEIYLHSVDSSKVAAADKIEGKFTLKLVDPPQEAATEGGEIEKGVTA